MTPVKGIVVCVEYDDLLAITLPRNARHLTEIVVVTSPTDRRTQEVVRSVPSARCFITDSFYRDGARFNKGAALEQGFDALGRDGWTLIWDADVLFPDVMPFTNLDPAKLYGARRRILENPGEWSPKFTSWNRLPLSRETGWPGFFQLFHGSCARIASRPWYDTTFVHAGGGDAYFQSRWPHDAKGYLPIEVLHLGPRDANWFGRASARTDGAEVGEVVERSEEMERLLAAHGWGGRTRGEPVNERTGWHGEASPSDSPRGPRRK